MTPLPETAKSRFFDPIVLGHNNFFGVDHLSSARGQEREAHFSDPRRILEVIQWAFDGGARGMMMSTHQRAPGVLQMIKTSPVLADQMRFYPLLPYAQKYVTAANEKGMLNVLFDVVSGTSGGEKLSLLWNGAKGVLSRDIFSLLSNLITVELKPFRGVNVPCVFLHDVFTDLALALGLKGIFEFYHEEMEKNFSCKAAFATKNLPLLLERFAEWKLPTPLVMPHINKIGFSMNPSREACEQAIARYPAHIMAMSTLASGYLSPDEAYQYIGSLKKVESVVVGASSRSHIDETLSAIHRHMGPF